MRLKLTTERIAEIESAVQAKHGSEFHYRPPSVDCSDTAATLGGSGRTIIHHFDNGESDWDKRKAGMVLEEHGELKVLAWH